MWASKRFFEKRTKNFCRRLYSGNEIFDIYISKTAFSIVPLRRGGQVGQPVPAWLWDRHQLSKREDRKITESEGVSAQSHPGPLTTRLTAPATEIAGTPGAEQPQNTKRGGLGPLRRSNLKPERAGTPCDGAIQTKARDNSPGPLNASPQTPTTPRPAPVNPLAYDTKPTKGGRPLPTRTQHVPRKPFPLGGSDPWENGKRPRRVKTTVLYGQPLYRPLMPVVSLWGGGSNEQ